MQKLHTLVPWVKDEEASHTPGLSLIIWISLDLIADSQSGSLQNAVVIIIRPPSFKNHGQLFSVVSY